LLRLPPGQLIHWAVLRSVGDQIPWYSDPMSAKWPESIITPRGAGWQPSETVDVHFALLAAMPGTLGLSGDLAGLPAAIRQRIRQAAVFYKTWRRMVATSIAHLLTPPRPLEDRTGWAALQLQDPEDTTSLLFVYRLDDWRPVQVFSLRNLAPEARYLIRQELTEGHPEVIASGLDLMTRGFKVKIEAANHATVYSIKRLENER
jgi:hypothetical protein